MKKRNILIPTLLSLLVASCNIAEDGWLEENTPVLETEKESLEKYAIILSRAVANQESLRAFIKKEALRQYDKDYDVFYPYVKDKDINGNETFEQLLSRYDTNDNLTNILESVPKLTILVPDYSWVGEDCFSIRTWDTSLTQIAVGYDDGEEKHTIYYNGEALGTINDNSAPAFPILIVKSNERMRLSTETKSGIHEYEFVSPVFDNTEASTKVGTWEGDYQNLTNNVSVRRDLVSEVGYKMKTTDLNVICPEAIDAYDEFGLGWGTGVQRDLTYYGMTADSLNGGALNPFRRDMIYRLKISPLPLFSIMDNTVDDPLTIMGTGRDDRPDFDGAISRMWANGSIELKLEFYQKQRDSSVGKVDDILLSIYPGDLMYLDHVHDVFQWNLLGNNWSVYSYQASDIQPKWFYPTDYGDVVYLHNVWNLYSASDNVMVKASEMDGTTTYTSSRTDTFKFVPQVSFTVGDELIKLVFGVSGESGTTTSFSVTYTDGADDLGTGYLEYTDNYITGQNGTDYYNLDYVSTYSMEFSLLPIDIRNKTSIKNYLLNRRSRE